MAAKKYNIKTIEDAVNCMTKENADVFLSDLNECLLVALQLKEGIKKQTGKYPEEAVMKEFTWYNDGKPGLRKITFINKIFKKK